MEIHPKTPRIFLSTRFSAMAMAAVLRRTRGTAVGCLAARICWWRKSGSVCFKLEAEAASYIGAIAAAEAKARGSAGGAGVGLASQKMCKSKLMYDERVVPALLEEFGYTSMNQIPKLEKIVVTANFRLERVDAVVLESTQRDLYILTGQRPTIFQATQNDASSAYRVGDPVGCLVTIRGELMYPFLDRLLNLVVPKTRDLQGVTTYGFIKGKYNLGTQDYTSISESRFDHIHKGMGLRISLVTGARSRLEAKRMLLLMGLPYFDDTAPRRPKLKKGRKGVRKTAAVAKKGADKKGAKGAKGAKKKK